MTITYKNFEIEVGESSFDLYQTRPPKLKHKANVSDEVKCCYGYFTKLPQVISKIIMIDMSNREEKVSLSNFLELYRTLKAEIESVIKV